MTQAVSLEMAFITILRAVFGASDRLYLILVSLHGSSWQKLTLFMKFQLRGDELSHLTRLAKRVYFWRK
jgi:hypothetical protein